MGKGWQRHCDEGYAAVEEQVAAQEKAKDAQANNWKLVSEVTGLTHPLLLHFPVALLLGGALFAVLGFRGESPLADAAYYCLWLGALTSVLAIVALLVGKKLGWRWPG